MVGSGPHQEESMGSRRQDHFLHLERRRGRERSDVNPIKNNETQQRKGTQDCSMNRFKWETSTRCL